MILHIQEAAIDVLHGQVTLLQLSYVSFHTFNSISFTLQLIININFLMVFRPDQ